MRFSIAKSWSLILGLVILAFFIVIAAFPWLFAPYGQNDIVGRPFQGPGEFALGTDEIGRDLLSRLIYGGSHEIFLSIGSAFVSTTIGTIIGLIAGLWGRATDWVTLRFTEIILAIPTLVLALFLITVWGRDFFVQLIALGIIMTPYTVKVARDSSRVLASRAFVEASLVAGANRWRVLWRHMIPNFLPTYIVMLTLLALSALVIVASLSYIGLGVHPSAASWGNTLRTSFTVVYSAPLMGLLSGACLILVGASYSLIGSGLGAAVEARTMGPR